MNWDERLERERANNFRGSREHYPHLVGKSIEEIVKERDYWKNQSEFRLKIILDLEKQLLDNCILPYSETRTKEHGFKC